jgi:uncharacterized protein
MSFLTAQWNDLAIINYEIDPKLLEAYIPIGTEMDLWQRRCYISLIGFMFENVKLLGIKVPFHINFEEVNLRFYVKRFENGQWKRGVVFIKEIVPKHAISFIANLMYNEHYHTMPMRHHRATNQDIKTFQYEWKTSDGWNSITVETDQNPLPIEVDSEAEFITEHYFGYTKYNASKTIEYEVTHPRWKQLEVKKLDLDVNFKSTYGNEFAFLQNLKPTSVIFAIGSDITIEGKRVIR